MAAHRPVSWRHIMRKFVAPLLVALIIAAPASGAFAATAMAPAAKPAASASTSAAQSINGTVKSFNLAARSLQLADGSWYFLPLNTKFPNVKAGDKVTVHYKQDGSNHDVTAIDVG